MGNIDIYVATNRVNDKPYVGQTSNLKKRIWTHGNEARLGSRYPFHRALEKYGMSNFDFATVSTASTKEQAANLEKLFIIVLGATNPKRGYNIAFDGEAPMRGRHHSERSKARMRARKAGKPLSAEHCAALKAAHTGPGYKGRTGPLLQKTRDAMSAAAIRRTSSDSWREQQSERVKNHIAVHGHPRQGTKHTIETIEKMKASHKGAGLGSSWVTDGVESKRIPPGTSIPTGWRRGRTFNG